MKKKYPSDPFLKISWQLAERLAALTPRLLQAFCLLGYLREGGKIPIYRLCECLPTVFKKGRYKRGRRTEAGERENGKTWNFIDTFSKMYGWTGCRKSKKRQFHKVLKGLGADPDKGLAALAVRYTPRADFPPEWRLVGRIYDGARFMKISLKIPDGRWVWEKGVDIRAHFQRELLRHVEQPSKQQRELFQASCPQVAWKRKIREAASAPPTAPPKIPFLSLNLPISKEIEKSPPRTAEPTAPVFKNFSGYRDKIQTIGLSGQIAWINYRQTLLKKTPSGEKLLLHHGRIHRREPGLDWGWREIDPALKKTIFSKKPRKQPEKTGRVVPGIEATQKLLREMGYIQPGRSGGALAGAALREPQPMGRSGLSPPGKTGLATPEIARAEGKLNLIEDYKKEKARRRG